MIKPIPTKDASGAPNGFLLPIHSDALSDYRVAQVYMTVVDPGCVKGPHLHKGRSGNFICVKGDVKIVTRTWGTYSEHLTGEAAGYNLVSVPPGQAAAIYNIGTEPAYVLNMPDKPWTPDNPDDWPVEYWEPPL